MNGPSLLASLRTAGLWLGAVLLLLGVNSRASAQMAEDLIPPDRSFVSPERFIVEFRAGPYNPDDEWFQLFFADDVGPLLELELDVIAYSIKDVLDITAGGALGYASYAGQSVIVESGERADEETTLKMLPMTLLATVRFDALARKFSIPVLLTGKLGYTWINYWTTRGSVEGDSKFIHGLRWAGQIALDLDTFEPATARVMDEEWGINHAFLFVELWGFEGSKDQFRLDDRTWTAGLGFNF